MKYDDLCGEQPVKLITGFSRKLSWEGLMVKDFQGLEL